jgi:hypothetical protein
MSRIPEYNKIPTVGHVGLVDLFSEPVLIEEKLDGSQISFAVIDGQLHMRSHNVKIDIDAPNAMFALAVESVKQRQSVLHEGWVYRGEYFNKPKHSTLAYDRVPIGNIMIFDISTTVTGENYLSYADKKVEAARIGFECVPFLAWIDPKEAGPITVEFLKSFLEQQSVLGGQQIEGIVIKNYGMFGRDHKILVGKLVSDKFKEVHRKDWDGSKPNKVDVIARIGDSLRSEARWNKAIQHLREKGQITDTPRDIGPLIKEITQDVWTEERDWIVAQLLQWVEKDINRLLTQGFPDWYKEQLLQKVLEEVNEKLENPV